MFLLVMVLAAFMAYHVNWIRDRQAVLNQASAVSKAPRPPHFGTMGSWPSSTLPEPEPQPKAPGLLWFFGEEGTAAITLEFTSQIGYSPDDLGDNDRKELDRVKRLFPEAKVQWFNRQNRSIFNRH